MGRQILPSKQRLCGLRQKKTYQLIFRANPIILRTNAVKKRQLWIEIWIETELNGQKQVETDRNIQKHKER